MVNKPMSEKTIVDNVLVHGVGAVNVDACRIPFQNENDVDASKVGFKYFGARTSLEMSKHSDMPKEEYNSSKGRFPANLLVSDGILDNGKITKACATTKVGKVYGENTGRTYLERKPHGVNIADSGGQSRFFDLDAWAKHRGFLDVAKASKSERNMGLTKIIGEGHIVQLTDKGGAWLCNNCRRKYQYSFEKCPKCGSVDRKLYHVGSKKVKNFHPTVKPIKLMAYLVELGCPEGGVVLDPFCGSGSTLIAAHRLNRKWIGIELNPEYAEITRHRLSVLNQKLSEFMSQ